MAAHVTASQGTLDPPSVAGLEIDDSSSKSGKEEQVKGSTLESRCVLEGYKTCRDSHLWKLMMSFYDRKGVESWSQGIVPHFITSNTFIGKSYAKVLHGFLRDSMAKGSNMPVDPTKPLYIIELGTGSGKFSFFMLKALEEMQAVCEFPLQKIVYVMTDFTESNFKFWREHPSLKDYFDRGILDAALFDAVNDEKITLWKSGKVLDVKSCENPICIVANYLFDTLYHDIFQVDEGGLKEGLISVGSKNPEEPDPLEPAIIGRLDNRYKYVPCDPAYYTNEDGDEAVIRRMLNWYKDHFKDTPEGASLLVPIGAMRALRRLAKLSGGRALVISGDKGNNNPEQFVGLMDPHIAVHGSFSLMVNYHAIGAYFTLKGGFALHNLQEEASLKCSSFLLDENTFTADPSIGEDEKWLGEKLVNADKERAKQYPHFTQAFHDNIDQFGPNDFFVLQKCLKEDCTGLALRSVVAMLKLSDWDPDVFFKFRDIILNHAPTCGKKLHNDLVRGIPRVWENYYLMDLDKDIAFEIGRFYYGIRDYTNALWYYMESSRTVGEHHVTFHNQGLCHYSKNNLEVALDNFRRALNMNQDYEKARSWVEKVEKEIKDMQQKKEEERLTVPGMPTGTGSAHVSSLPPPAPDATSAPVATN